MILAVNLVLINSTGTLNTFTEGVIIYIQNYYKLYIAVMSNGFMQIGLQYLNQSIVS